MHLTLKRTAAAAATSAALVLSATPAAAAVVAFDDFSSNQGWTLGTNWQIGPTSVSPPGTGNPDPAFDKTPTADNGVLGALLGGNIGAPEGQHGFYYATSKFYDLTGVTGSSLSFWRWLNSDYDPFMTSQVEVFNGSTWNVIYTNCCVGGNGLVTDSAWNLQSYDVSAYADNNSKFAVRFSYDVTASGVYTISGWNVDDLTVSGNKVPEPASLALVGLALAGAGAASRRRRAA
jgi:hypothetical protein